MQRLSGRNYHSFKNTLDLVIELCDKGGKKKEPCISTGLLILMLLLIRYLLHQAVALQ